MTEPFLHDVFISYSSKDRAVARDLAERLKRDGLRVWWDREIQPGGMIRRKIVDALKRSRVLVLVITANSLKSVWVEYEQSLILFGDPTNAAQRLIPVLAEDVVIPIELSMYEYVDWRQESREEYGRLLVACRASGCASGTPGGNTVGTPGNAGPDASRNVADTSTARRDLQPAKPRPAPDEDLRTLQAKEILLNNHRISERMKLVLLDMLGAANQAPGNPAEAWRVYVKLAGPEQLREIVNALRNNFRGDPLLSYLDRLTKS